MTERPQREVLLDIVRGARRRLRARQLLHGASVVAVTLLLSAMVAAYGADHFRFAPAVVWTARMLVVALPLTLAAWLMARRLLHPVSDLQIALYLEEHAPSLDARLVSAIECARRGARSHTSRALEERLVAEALEHSARVGHGRAIERPAMTRSGGLLAGSMAVGAALLLVGPGAVRRGVAGLVPGGVEHDPYGIVVSPSDTVVARGSDLKVTARLRNFTADRVELSVRRGNGEWRQFPMTAAGDSTQQTIVLFKLNEPTDYFVSAGGVRSGLVHVGVADLPHVARIDLEYHFPAYTGLPVRQVADGGDIAALRGTRVRVTVTPTIAPAGAALVIGGRDTVALTVQAGGALAGELTVTRASSYRVVFRTAAAGTIPGSGDYAIDALSDQPPVVRFEQPAHDVQVTSVEELYTEAEAQDDYGVAHLDLVYRVNGGPERTVALGPGGAHKDVVGSYTFELEDLGLKPGDLVAYYARAREADHVGGAQEATSDIYFMQVRPFDRSYKAADAQGGGASGQNASAGALSQREREIVAGTFNLIRDSASYSESAYRENLATLALAQGKLREDVATLVSRIKGRGIIGMDSTFAVVAEALTAAFQQMQQAEQRLGERKAKDALPPEQAALQQVQRAEAVYHQTQVARGGGPGGGGGEQQSAEDLADLFDLQMDKLKNQYEQVQRGERQQADQQVDAALERLKELARRQQQENERLRARQQEQAAGAGGGASGGQRDLAQQTDSVARQLERLAREQHRPDLNGTAERLRAAANAMRQAAAQGASTGGAGAARGREALDRLREAQQRLEGARNDRLRRDVADAVRRAEDLAQQERKVQQMVDRLQPQSQDAGQQIAQLDQRKIAMAQQTAQLQHDIDSLSRESVQDQPEASRQLGAAADSMRDARLHDKILYSRGVIRGSSKEYAQNFEQQIGSDIDRLRRQLADAGGAIGESKGERIARALDQAHDLINGLQSMQERMQAGQGRAEVGRGGQQGQARAEAGRSGQTEQEGQTGPAMPGRPGGRRQLQSELRQRMNDAEQLRDTLRAEGVDVGGLSRAMDRLRQLQAPLLRGDAKAVAALGSQVVEGLKEYEFAVRRQFAEADEQRPFGTGADQVPEQYRKLVEEYYKALAGKKP